MRQNRKTVFKTLAVFAMVAFFLFVAIGQYIRVLGNSLSIYACHTLGEIIRQQRYSFISTYQEQEITLSTISQFFADALSIPEQKTPETLQRLLTDAQLGSNFEMTAFIEPDGTVVSPNMEADAFGTLPDRLLERTLAGEKCIYGPFTFPNRPDVKDSILFTTPVLVDSEVIGILLGTMQAQTLGLQATASFDGSGFTYICSSQGDIITVSGAIGTIDHGHSLLEILSNADFVEHDDYATIKANLAAQTPGHSIYRVDDTKLLMHYEPLQINDWMLVSVVPDKIISSQWGRISFYTVLLVAGVVLVFLVILQLFVTNHRRYAQLLFRTAYYDELTGLPNLTKFKMDATALLQENPSRPFYISKLDIIQFKMINEMYGFDAGNRMIQVMANALSSLLNKMDNVVGRVTADEFIYIAPYVDDEHIDYLHHLFEKLILEQTTYLGNHKFQFCYGRYYLDADETDLDSAVEKLSLAHRLAKQRKGNYSCAYDESFKQKVVAEVELSNRMEDALASKEFVVYLQPKYRLDTEKIAGAEALVRWVTGNETIAYPSSFIPLFEKNGFVTKLDFYMLRRICEIMQGWQAAAIPLIPVSINFSRLHLQNEHFVDELDQLVTEYGIPKHFIEIELTETTIFDNEATLHSLLHRLHQAGFSLSMDDFGSGYSSLGLLKNLPVDIIKIDRTFFVDNLYKTRARTVIESIMSMAHTLGIATVAEGVESQEQIDLLREVGCDMVQGYYYSRPIMATEFRVDAASVHHPKEPMLLTLRYEELGDIATGRAALDTEMPVEIHRLFSMATSRILHQHYGRGEADDLLRQSGIVAGTAFAKKYLNLELPLEAFIPHLSNVLERMKIGLLNVESHDDLTGHTTFAISNDLECSGISTAHEQTLCRCSEGFVEGILTQYTGRSYSVMEVDCWDEDSPFCQFDICRK